MPATKSSSLAPGARADTSGYTTPIQPPSLPFGDSPEWGHLQQVYSSPSGYTRLHRAMRYGKRFILKSLKPEFQHTPIYQQALRKEFEIGFQLDHPNICRTVGFESVAPLGHAIILEYIDGCTLEEALAQQDASQLAEIKQQFLPGGQLFSALRYIHSKQIVHRDLKPSNIMITHNGNTLKLIDFSLSDSDAFGILKQPAGTRDYIAPEQLLPGATTDVRADIYSLGIILRQLAYILHDRQMSAIADVCSQRDVNLRPTSVQAITLPPSGGLGWGSLLVFVLTALALTIYILLTLKFKGYL